MKKSSLLVLVIALVVFVSCNDQSADSAGTVSDSSANTNRAGNDNSTTPPATPPKEYSTPPATAGSDKPVRDTPRTSISVGKDGASVETKRGTGVSYDKSGIKVESRDVKIDVKRDTL